MRGPLGDDKNNISALDPLQKHMIAPADFTTYGIQTSAFLSNGTLRPASVLVRILQHYGEVYDGEPISIPLPTQAPSEIPSVILTSSDNALRVEVARSQVSLYWNRIGGAAPVALEELLATFADRLATIFEETAEHVGRLGIVVTRQATVDDPGRVLSRKYCRDRWTNDSGPMNRPEGFELHAHKVFNLTPDLPVNSWMRIRAAQDNEQVYRYVVIQQDINTLAEELKWRDFSRSDISTVLAAAAEESESILAKYFPDNDE